MQGQFQRPPVPAGDVCGCFWRSAAILQRVVEVLACDVPGGTRPNKTPLSLTVRAKKSARVSMPKRSTPSIGVPAGAT
jgi:hypothetical protein